VFWGSLAFLSAQSRIAQMTFGRAQTRDFLLHPANGSHCVIPSYPPCASLRSDGLHDAPHLTLVVQVAGCVPKGTIM